jgi:hypothetical protein
MSIFRKLFRKREYNIKNKNMSEEKTANIYVWQKSERIGKIVVEKETKDGWLYFTDGSRINPKLTSEFLSQATSMEEAEGIAKILSPVAGVAQAGTGDPHKLDNQDLEGTEWKGMRWVTKKPEVETKTNTEDSIVVGILEKLSKKNKTNFDISVGVNIPGKTIFKALQMDMEEEELKEGLVKLVKKQINNLEQQLNKEVETFIQNQYYE